MIGIPINLKLRIDQSKSILKRVLKDLRLNLDPEQVRAIISSQKSNGISAEQFYESRALTHHGRMDQKSLAAVDLAQAYLYPHIPVK
jgi:hypothetical protein